MEPKFILLGTFLLVAVTLILILCSPIQKFIVQRASATLLGESSLKDQMDLLNQGNETFTEDNVGKILPKNPGNLLQTENQSISNLTSDKLITDEEEKGIISQDKLSISDLTSTANTIDCNSIIDTCNGTSNTDTMTGTDLKGPENSYTINGLGGSDTITANEKGKFETDLRIVGDDGDDKIFVKIKTKNHSVFATGDSGDDSITLLGPGVGSSHIEIQGLGGPGADTIKASLSPSITLYQNGIATNNAPDGSKDILDCGNAPHSTASISLEDGDIATNCEVIVTGLEYPH